jgi:soluble lytic murein transglycosylase-like protein
VSVSLLKAVSKVESNFTPTAVSGSGAIGLMQLMPSTAKALGVTNAYDPEQNIMGGAKYLAASLDEFNDVSLALAAYNAGGGAVRNCGNKVPSYAQGYVDRVLAYYLS